MPEKKRSKVAIWVVSILVIVIAAFGIYSYQKSNKKVESATETKTEQVQSKVISYAGEDGKTVFELLNAKYTVVSETSTFGVMVKSINGLAATSSEFWLYSINGKSGDVGADKAVTKAGDQVLWEYKGF